MSQTFLAFAFLNLSQALLGHRSARKTLKKKSRPSAWYSRNIDIANRISQLYFVRLGERFYVRYKSCSRSFLDAYARQKYKHKRKNDNRWNTRTELNCVPRSHRVILLKCRDIRELKIARWNNRSEQRLSIKQLIGSIAIGSCQYNELALELTRRERFTLLSMLWPPFYRYLIDISALAYRLSRDSFARDHNLFSALVDGSYGEISSI